MVIAGTGLFASYSNWSLSVSKTQQKVYTLSNGKLLARDLSGDLEAAILGDFERLKSGSGDAQHFALAFSADAGQPWWAETDPEGVLGVAAKAVGSERRGESDTALALYREVAREKAPWVRLLGLLLQGWSFLLSDTKPILAAAREVQSLRRSPRKARLLAKLSIFASDKGDIGTARSLWIDAIDASDEKTELGRALRIEAMNLGLGMPDLELLNTPTPDPDDYLVQPENIERLQLRSANSFLTQSVEDDFGGVWRYTIRMGATPLDDLLSAEAQARWIGLPWMRRTIRKQLGAQLLAGAADESDGWAQGVLLWTLGGGSQPHLALNYAEPHFDNQSADSILAGIGECDPTKNRFNRLASLGAEAWDLISDASLQKLASEVTPSPGEGSPETESRKIWAAFAIRLTDAWFDRYQQLDADIQASLFDSLEPIAVRHFNDGMKTAMYAALGDDDAVLADGGLLLPFAAALAPPDDDPRLKRLIESGQPLFTRIISQLKVDRPTVISRATEARFVGKLRDALIEQSEGARKGTISLGGPGPGFELGRMLSVVDSPDRDLVDLLIETAIDPTLPPQYLTEARRGLVLLRRSGRLRVSDLRRLRAAPEAQGQGPLEEGLTQGVLRALLLQILAEKTTVAERSELVSAVRSSEERIRDVAVNTCAEALRTCHDEGLAWAVVSGLFDPSHSVADGALAGMRPLTEHFEAAAEVAWQRLPELFESSSRDVRSQIIHTLNHVRPKTRRQKEKRSALVARARLDRSWLVREAAAELTAES
jgi:hypothetical protein